MHLRINKEKEVRLKGELSPFPVMQFWVHKRDERMLSRFKKSSQPKMPQLDQKIPWPSAQAGRYYISVTELLNLGLLKGFW